MRATNNSNSDVNIEMVLFTKITAMWAGDDERITNCEWRNGGLIVPVIQFGLLKLKDRDKTFHI